ncbi:MAG TPA: hypothetical protein VKE88_01240 [Candidatus Nanoarchaeia archaeon]|nr:hypothetical protein [Candidatus Nanoarchaeia archaeon]
MTFELEEKTREKLIEESKTRDLTQMELLVLHTHPFYGPISIPASKMPDKNLQPITSAIPVYRNGMLVDAGCAPYDNDLNRRMFAERLEIPTFIRAQEPKIPRGKLRLARLEEEVDFEIPTFLRKGAKLT